MPTAVSDWLADALNTAGREGSADKAFLLKRGRQGRKKSDMAERNLRIVLYVERLREQRVPLKDSRNRMGAFSIVGGLPDVNLSGDEVEVIYEEYQRLKKQRKGFFEEAKERLLRG